MIESVVTELVRALTRPESFVLLAWVLTEKISAMRREREDNEIIGGFLTTQKEISGTLIKLTTMIESMFRASGR